MIVRVPSVLTIAGSDSCGGAGIQADLKTFAAIGVHGACVITAVTSQNTQGVYEVMPLPPGMVKSQINTVLRDIPIEYAKTGMLYSAEIMRTVASAITEYGLKAVVDPVIRAGSGHLLVRQGAEAALIREMIPRAYVVTPNRYEAEYLAGISIRSLDDAEEAARRIAELGAKAVLIKGGHLESSSEVVDLLYHDGVFTRFVKPRLDVYPHGSGCVLSSAIAAYLAKGKPLEEAVASAEEFIRVALSFPLSVGGGRQPVNPLASLINEAEKYKVISDVERAVELFVKNPELHAYVAEVGTQIAMALPYASTPEHVAGVEGRIVRTSKGARAVGCVGFGASSHMARLIITAMKHEPTRRAAMNLRYDANLLEILKGGGAIVASFDRRAEPKEVKFKEGATLPWGLEGAVKELGVVPDVLYDFGEVGKEPMIRLLGTSATSLVEWLLDLVKASQKIGKS